MLGFARLYLHDTLRLKKPGVLQREEARERERRERAERVKALQLEKYERVRWEWEQQGEEMRGVVREVEEALAVFEEEGSSATLAGKPSCKVDGSGRKLMGRAELVNFGLEDSEEEEDEEEEEEDEEEEEYDEEPAGMESLGRSELRALAKESEADEATRQQHMKAGAVLQSLRESLAVIEGRFMPLTHAWIGVVTRADPMDSAGRDDLLKAVIDLRAGMRAAVQQCHRHGIFAAGRQERRDERGSGGGDSASEGEGGESKHGVRGGGARMTTSCALSRADEREILATDPVARQDDEEDTKGEKGHAGDEEEREEEEEDVEWETGGGSAAPEPLHLQCACQERWDDPSMDRPAPPLLLPQPLRPAADGSQQECDAQEAAAAVAAVAGSRSGFERACIDSTPGRGLRFVRGPGTVGASPGAATQLGGAGDCRAQRELARQAVSNVRKREREEAAREREHREELVQRRKGAATLCAGGTDGSEPRRTGSGGGAAAGAAAATVGGGGRGSSSGCNSSSRVGGHAVRDNGRGDIAASGDGYGEGSFSTRRGVQEHNDRALRAAGEQVGSGSLRVGEGGQQNHGGGRGRGRGANALAHMLKKKESVRDRLSKKIFKMQRRGGGLQ